MLLALGIARAVTEVSVQRIRTAGLEMLWRTDQRASRIARGEQLEIEAEVRNRDGGAVRYSGLRPVAAPELEVTVEPTAGEVPAGGRLRVTIAVRGLRVGRHAVHGLSLEVQAGPGLFEVPLTFANPHGVEVLPPAYARKARSGRGGRGRRDVERGRRSPFSGESSELRELRQHHTGDPFRRIAWKASARRGELLVREYEREERDVVFLVVDASVELFAGRPGQAALDAALDQAADVGLRHLSLGDRVGLAIVGRRLLAWLRPEAGQAQGLSMMDALSHAVSPVHADRSALDESDVAARVLEHMRPLDPSAAGRLRLGELDRIAARAERLTHRAPFPQADAFAEAPRERALRRYLSAFGVGSPARLGPDRGDADRLLIEILGRLSRERPRPSIVHVWSPPPERSSRAALLDALPAHRSRRTALIWTSLSESTGIAPADGYAGVVAGTLGRREELARGRAERELLRRGIRVESLPGASRASAGG